MKYLLLSIEWNPLNYNNYHLLLTIRKLSYPYYFITDKLFTLIQISSFIFDFYSINLCLGYQLCLICLLIPLYFSIHLHRYPGIFLPNVWTLPSESCLPFCLEQVYSYLCGQGGDVTDVYSIFKGHLPLEGAGVGLCRCRYTGQRF